MILETITVTMPFFLNEERIKIFNKVTAEKLLPSKKFLLNDNYYFYRRCWASLGILGTQINYSFRCKRKFTKEERSHALEDLKKITAYVFYSAAKEATRGK